MTPRGQATLGALLGWVGWVGVASWWGVTGEEALWWTSGAARWLPPAALALRAPGLLLHLVAVLMLLPFARAPRVFVALAMATPAIAGGALLATGEGWASGLWGCALAAGLHGGPGLLVAGVLVGLGLGLGSSTASTLLALPWLLAVAQPGSWRARWPLAGIVAAGLGVGVFGVEPPAGGPGPLTLAVHQGLLSAPLVGVAWVAAVVRGGGDAVDRVARLTSLPVLVGGLLFAILGWSTPTESVSLAWWGGLLLVARAQGPAGRLGETAAWLAPLLAVAVVVHAYRPVLLLERDPAAALWAGEPLGDDSVRWAMPVGVPRHDPRALGARTVVTDRATTAAWVRFHTGIPAVVSPACGDRLVGTVPPDRVLVTWGVPPPCLVGASQPSWVRSPVHGPSGQRLGVWSWAEVAAAR